MAHEEKENPYEGLGTGGKFRKRPFRRTQTKPYDRPSTSLSNNNNNNINNGWFSKVVNPAQKFITYSAHSLFSSLFRKRLHPPQSQSQSQNPSSGTETEQEERNNRLEESAFKQVSNNSSGKKQVNLGNGESDAQITCPDGGGLTELEKLLRQKTFTRSEIDHLTALMRSRTVATPIREEEKHTEAVSSEPMLFSEQKDEDPKTPIVENRIENHLPLTPYVTSSVPIEDVASPAELAKAYMGSRPSKVSSSIFGMRSHAAREDQAFLKSNVKLPLNSPIMPIVPSTVKHVAVHENGFATTRSRGRSAIYSMARTPYARIYPTSTFKGVGRTVKGEPSSSTHSIPGVGRTDQDMLYGSIPGSIKRRSSALDNDVGSVGPIRRTRHKANLYSKGLSIPPSGSSLSIARSGLAVCAAHQPSSSMRKPIMLDEVKHRHMNLPEESVEGTRPSKSGPLPSKSSEMASKILQQLDKMVSPKEKSSESRLPTVNDKSPMKLSPSMLHGQALRSMEAADSSKSLDTVKDDRFNFAPGKLPDSAQKLTSQIDKVENGQLKLLAPSDCVVPPVTDADLKNPRNQTISAGKSVDSSMIKSASYPPQKRRAFHPSAQEDCLDKEDDAYANGERCSVLPVDTKMTSPTAMAVKGTFGTESVPQENTQSLSVVMSSKNKESHAGTDNSANGSVAGAKVDVSTSLTSSIPDPTFKAGTAVTKTIFGSDKPVSPNGSSAIPTAFNFGNKMAPSKNITNPGTIFGLEKAVSSKELDADVPSVNFGSNVNAGKVPQMLFTSSPVGGESTLPSFSVSSDSKLGSSISSATVSAATDSMPKVRESANVDAKSSTDSVRSSEIPVSSAVTTSLFTSPSVFTFGQSNGSLAASPSLSSPFTSQNVFSSSCLAASSSSIGATNTPSTISSSSSSSSNPLVASSSSTTPFFKFGSSHVPSTGLPVSSSGSEPLDTKNRQDVRNGNLSSTVFGTSSSAVGNTGSGLFGFSSSAMTAINSQSQGSIIGSSSGSMFNAQTSPATSGFATSTQTQSVPIGLSASSTSFGLTGNTSSSGTPATNAAFSFGISSFPSSSSASNIFNSGTTFGLGTPASSSAVNSVSSNNGSSSSLFGSSSWQPSNSSPFGSAFNQTSAASVSSTTSPTMFSSTPQFSFTSAATTSTQSAFGNSNSVFTFGSSPVNNDQMTMEDSMAEDTVQATPPVTPVFGQQATPPATSVFGQQATPPATSVFGQQATPPATPVFGQKATPPATSVFGQQATPPETSVFGQQATPPATPIFGQQATPPATPVFGQQATPPATPVFGQQSTPVQSNFVFGASTPSGASPFQFGSQQNTNPPNPSPFQASGSVEFSAGGGSFSLGTGGGDKSGRRIVKVKGRQRKK